MKGKDLVKKMEKSGWEIVRIKGSHYVMKKDNMTEIIPVHCKDLPRGLLRTIIKRTSIK